MRKFGTVLSGALAIVFALVIASSCGGRVETLKFTLPPGFSGLIIVVADPVNGSELEDGGGLAQLKVPDDGIVRVKSLEVFGSWHSEQFLTADGVQLESNNPTRQKGVVEVHSLGRSGTIEGDATSQDVVVYFVGTFEEVSRYQEQMDRSGKGLPTVPARSN